MDNSHSAGKQDYKINQPYDNEVKGGRACNMKCFLEKRLLAPNVRVQGTNRGSYRPWGTHPVPQHTHNWNLRAINPQINYPWTTPASIFPCIELVHHMSAAVLEHAPLHSIQEFDFLKQFLFYFCICYFVSGRTVYIITLEYIWIWNTANKHWDNGLRQPLLTFHVPI